MSGHTKGPWEVNPYDPRCDKEITILGGAIIVDYDDVNHEEQEANARLIAASPCLLAALKSLVKSIAEDEGEMMDAEENWPEMKAAVAAIAKAEGPQ